MDLLKRRKKTSKLMGGSVSNDKANDRVACFILMKL